MKTETLITLLFVLSFSLFAKSQDNVTRNQIVYYKKPADISTDDVRISFTEIKSHWEWIIVLIDITNKTNEQLIFKPRECSFLFNNNDFNPTNERIVIPPGVTEKIRLRVGRSEDVEINPFFYINPGIGRSPTNPVESEYKSNKFAVNSFEFSLSGIYHISADVEILPQFNLNIPIEEEGFFTNGFYCDNVRLKLKKNDVVVYANCIYDAKGIGKTNANQVRVITTDNILINVKSSIIDKSFLPNQKLNFWVKYSSPEISGINLLEQKSQLLFGSTFENNLSKRVDINYVFDIESEYVIEK